MRVVFLLVLLITLFSVSTFAIISVSSSQVDIDFDYIYKDIYYAQQGDTSRTQSSCRGERYDQYWHKDCVLDLSGMSVQFTWPPMLAIWSTINLIVTIINGEFKRFR